jgi:hypothetical protein
VVGNNSFISNTTGINNTSIGQYVLRYNTTGGDNIGIGQNALEYSLIGSNNVAVGTSALSNSTGNQNTALGSTVQQNKKIGTFCLAVGANAGSNDISGNYLTFLGFQADVSSNTLIYNSSTAVGYNSIIDASNQIVLGTINEKVKIPGSYVGINGVYNPASGYVLDVNGSVGATSYNITSDYRIKKDVTTLGETFTVDNLNPVTYNNINLGKQDIGLIAHELQEIYPFLVNGEKDGEHFQSVNYTGIIGILIKEIQELKKDVKILKENIHL